MAKKNKKVEDQWLKSYGKRKKHLKYPDISMYDLIEKEAINFKDLYAYNFFGSKVTYTDFIFQIDRCARSFKAMKIEKGDVVTICSANVPEAVIAIYALNKIGAVANVVHPLSSENEIKYALNLTESTILLVLDLAWKAAKKILDDTKVKKTIILSVKDSLKMLTKIGYEITAGRKVEKVEMNDEVISWIDFIRKGIRIKGDINSHGKGSDPALILYSGGTSGKSKGILLSNMSLNSNAMQLRSFVPEVIPGRVMLGIMPIFHGFGFCVGFHTMFYGGCCNYMVPRFEADKFDKILAKQKPNFVVGVPTLYEAMLKNKKIQSLDLSFLKLCISGGDSLSESLQEQINELLFNCGSDIKMAQGYGLTESVSAAILNPGEATKKGSIGIPLADNYVKIVRPKTYLEVPIGEQGEIVLMGPSLMDGYLNEEEETNQTLQIHPDGNIWLHTGDLGYMDEEGYIFFSSRLKRMIISSGYNIYPNRIEEIIEQVPEVLMATVIGMPDKYKGQIAKAFVVLKEGIKPKDDIKKRIREHCKRNLAKYSLPKDIEFRKSLPKTKLGKVAYTELEKE